MSLMLPDKYVAYYRSTSLYYVRYDRSTHIRNAVHPTTECIYTVDHHHLLPTLNESINELLDGPRDE